MLLSPYGGTHGVHFNSVQIPVSMSFTAGVPGWLLWPSGTNSEEVGAAMGSAPGGHSLLIG